MGGLVRPRKSTLRQPSKKATTKRLNDITFRPGVRSSVTYYQYADTGRPSVLARRLVNEFVCACLKKGVILHGIGVRGEFVVARGDGWQQTATLRVRYKDGRDAKGLNRLDVKRVATAFVSMVGISASLNAIRDFLNENKCCYEPQNLQSFIRIR